MAKKKQHKKKGNEVLRNYLYAGIIVVVVLTVINSTDILSSNTILGQAVGADVRRPAVTSDIVPISCEDSDGGLDYNTAGMITTKFQMSNGNVITRVFEDRCAGTKKVIETYCVGNIFGSKDYDCSGTCTAGACDTESTQPRTYLFNRP